MSSSQTAKSTSLQRQGEPEQVKQHERPASHPYWLNTAIGSMLQYTLERESEWARG